MKLGDGMQLGNGKRIDIDNLKPDDIDEFVIAESLSKICRYAGQGLSFYSVAEHSCHLSDYILRETLCYNTALGALLHDAAESIIGDIPHCVRKRIPEINKLDYRLSAIIFERFQPVTFPWCSVTHEADKRIVVDEMKVLFPSSNINYSREPLGINLKFWDFETARNEFLNRFHDLYARIK